MPELLSLESLAALVTLTALEIVLGIDNIVFLTIVTGKLEEARRPRAQRIGLLLAMGMRILLLLVLSWIMKLTSPFFALFGHDFSGRDLILLGGGLFLLGKATFEIHDKLEGPVKRPGMGAVRAALGAVLVQVALLDLVFSLDSVITAVGMARRVEIMIAAVVLAVGAMMFLAGPVGRFVEDHPTIKMLALSFLLLIGVMLVVEGLGQHLDKGYVYFAMAFSLFVELLNLKLWKRQAARQTGG